MAGNPIQRGGSWQVRWRHPDPSLPQRDFSAPVWDKRDGELLRDWLNGLMDTSPKVKNAAFPDDPEIKYGVFRGGTIPQHLLADRRWTFGEYATAYQESLGSLAKTKREYLRTLRNHAADWWDVDIREISRTMLEEKLAELKVAHKIPPKRKDGKVPPPQILAPKTQATTIARIAGVLSAAHREGVIPRNPFAANTANRKPQIPVRSVSNAERLREDEEIFIPPNEWGKILDAARDIDTSACLDKRWIKPEVRYLHETQTVDMLWLLGVTGCRISEVHGLEVRHAKAALHSHVLPIKWQRRYDEHARPVRALPKGERKGTVAIPAALAEHLQKYVEGRPPEASLFPSPGRGDGGWLYSSWWQGRWRKTLARARTAYGLSPELNPAPHSIRHSVGTWLLDVGMEIRDVAEHLRHMSTRMVEEVYAKRSAAMMARLRGAQEAEGFPARPAVSLTKSPLTLIEGGGRTEPLSATG